MLNNSVGMLSLMITSELNLTELSAHWEIAAADLAGRVAMWLWGCVLCMRYLARPESLAHLMSTRAVASSVAK